MHAPVVSLLEPTDMWLHPCAHVTSSACEGVGRVGASWG